MIINSLLEKQGWELVPRQGWGLATADASEESLTAFVTRLANAINGHL